MARTRTSICCASALLLALLLLGAPPGAQAAAVRAAPVDLTRGRSQEALSRQLAEVRARVVPEKVFVPSYRVPPDELIDHHYWGDFAVALNGTGSEDPRELESTFTLPGTLSLYSVDLRFNMRGESSTKPTTSARFESTDRLHRSGKFGLLKLRNITDDDATARLFLRNPGVFKVDLFTSSSRFFNIPPQDRNTRTVHRGLIETSEMPFIPIRLSYDLQQVQGLGALGPRDWESRELTFGTHIDAVLADLLVEFPFRFFDDDIDRRNQTRAHGMNVRLGGGGLFGAGSSLGFQRYKLFNRNQQGAEDVTILDASYVNRRVYGIRGLESRTRGKLELRKDQISRTARTKTNAETFSLMTYRRNRRLQFEMGGRTSRVKRHKIDRRGLAVLAADPTTRREDVLRFQQEDKPLVMEGWTGASYRGIKRLNVNLRTDAASIRRNPRTDFGTFDAPPLYPDTRTGLLVDLDYNPYSPVWGLGLKVRTDRREHVERAAVTEGSVAALTGRYSPWPWLSMHGQLSQTEQDSNLDTVRPGQTDTEGYQLGVVYESGPASQVWFDYYNVNAHGALTARESVISMGLEAWEDNVGRGTWRLLLSRARLNVEDILGPVLPYLENLVTLQRSQKF